MIKVMTVHYQTLPTLTATKNVPLIWKAKPAILTSYIKLDSNLKNILDDNDSEFEESAEELVDGINILIICKKLIVKFNRSGFIILIISESSFSFAPSTHEK